MSEVGSNVAYIKSLPVEIWETIPAAIPPPGVTPNFEHPQSLLPAVLSVQLIFLLSATVSYAIRIYMKAVFLKIWRWDDTMLTLGFLFTLLYLSSVISGTVYGYLGKHLWEVHINVLFAKASLYCAYVVNVAVAPSLAFIKMSFLIQFYYLFKPLRWLRLSCWIGGSIIGFLYAGISIASLVLSSPWPGEDLFTDILSWHYLAFINTNIPTGVLSLTTDSFLLILPIPAVMGLQMALRKKIGVLVTFALGALAVVGSTMSLYYRILLYLNADTPQIDPGWVSGYIEMWTQVELLVGITAANMPIVHLFFVRGNFTWRTLGRTIMRVRNLSPSTRQVKSDEKEDTRALRSTYESHEKGELATHSGLDKSHSEVKKYEFHTEMPHIPASQDYIVSSDLR